MSAPKHAVKVSILNEDFTIKSDASPDHTRAVAQYLDQAARQVMASGASVESSRAVILAALRITGELFEERKASAELSTAVRALADEIRPLLPPAKRASGATSVSS
jgi:cell division protein ZapA